jgi:hypothetical protein
MDENIHSGHGKRDEDVATQPCASWQPMLTLLAAGEELDPAEQDRLAAHLAGCAACSAALVRERELLALLAAHREEPDAGLLASCRAGLSDALDREEERGWLRRTLGLLLPASWLSPRPAWSAAILLLIGFSAGFFGPRLLRHPVPAAPAAPGNAAVHPSANANAGNAGAPLSANNASPTSTAPSAADTVNSGSAPTRLDVRPADVAAIRVLPTAEQGLPRIELQLRARQSATLEGTVDDDDVKSALLDIMRHTDRYDQAVRLNAVGLLSACSSDPEVRAALCRTVRTDRNPAVRLKALESLGDADSQDIVRQTLLDALSGDDNLNVRIGAINTLLNMTARGQMASDPRALAVLRDRMQRDPNAYIRMQSAAAIRAISTGSSSNGP